MFIVLVRAVLLVPFFSGDVLLFMSCTHTSRPSFVSSHIKTTSFLKLHACIICMSTKDMYKCVLHGSWISLSTFHSLKLEFREKTEKIHGICRVPVCTNFEKSFSRFLHVGIWLCSVHMYIHILKSLLF